MPAVDRLHHVVVRALEKDRWRITGEHVFLAVGRRRLWIDIRAQKSSEARIILVEAKGFEYMPSPIEYLASAVGQYVVYRAALDVLDIDAPLYLAVPQSAYRGILSEEIGVQVRQHTRLQMLVFDDIHEEIVEWINS